MAILGDIVVELDPWEAEMGSELPIDGAPSTGIETADLAVEVAGPWAPIRGESAAVPRSMRFVDGIRRTDARVLLRPRDRERAEGEATVAHGVFATTAAGSVRVEGGVATFEDVVVERIIATGSGTILGGNVVVREGSVYRPLYTDETDPEAPLRVVQAQMRAAEERLARSLAAVAELVVVDGPLTFDASPRVVSTDEAAKENFAVGFVKRIHELYVGERISVVAKLAVGERSPIFALRASHRFARYSWFIRLGQPMIGEADLTGLARLEVSLGVGLDRAKRLADLTATTLPRFVPSRARDPRAPQNLLPIGALEAHMRRLLGDRRLTRRFIRSKLAEDARG